MIHEQPDERKQWFIDRIGKIVYRNKTSCECVICADVYKHGLVIANKMHADYLYDCEAIYTAEGNPLRYFDTKEEVIKFEKTL